MGGERFHGKRRGSLAVSMSPARGPMGSSPSSPDARHLHVFIQVPLKIKGSERASRPHTLNHSWHCTSSKTHPAEQASGPQAEAARGPL